MRTPILKIAAILILLAGALAAQAAAATPTVESVGKAIVCQCGGCNFPVATCNHEQCSSRDQMKAMAEKEIAAGKTEGAILRDFVGLYGMKVLAAPPASGFNLTVWILPGIALLAGLTLVVVLLKRWRRSRATPPSLPPGADPKLMDAVEEEMERLGMRN